MLGNVGVFISFGSLAPKSKVCKQLALLVCIADGVWLESL